MSKALRKLNSYIAKTNCLVFFIIINQIREKMGIIFSNPEINPGGIALRFYSSVRVELRRSEQILLNNQLVGYKTKVKIFKNKVAASFQMTVLNIYFDHGICKSEELISLCLNGNILQKNGSWYSCYGEQKLGLGRDKVREFYWSRLVFLGIFKKRKNNHLL